MEEWRKEFYLAHHGILGMKWGKRQGPPYPLGASDHSASEKKAGWRKSLGNAIRSLNQKRLSSAAKAAQRDAEDLRKHGYTKEANAVQKVANKNRAKANATYNDPDGNTWKIAGKPSSETARKMKEYEQKKKAQKKEFDLAKKSQTMKYRNDYDRMLDYQSKSKTVQERSKELKELSDKAKDLDMKLSEYEYNNPKVYDEAYKRAIEAAKKDPGYGQYGEKVDSNLVDYYLYDGGIFDKTINDLNKTDPEFQKLKKEYNNTIKEYKAKCKEITNDIIGEYGDTPVSGLGSSINYRELVYYALSKPNTMWMFTSDEDIGRK